MKIIAVIGAGTMGNGIAHVFAQHHYKVHLIDTNEKALQKALEVIEINLDRMVSKEIIAADLKWQTLQNIHTFTDLESGVIPADLVVEAIVENVEIKQNLFKKLGEICKPQTILASNTSSISITKLASVVSHPNRIIGMHFMNPVPLMPLVEVVKAYQTDVETIETIIAITLRIDKTPIESNDFPGFIVNRILMPMINEAIETLQNGVAGVAEIDGVMKLGMAHPMGPLQLADFIGLDVCLSILNVLYDGFKNPKYAPNPLLVNMVQAGKLGVKSGEGFYDYSLSRKAEVVSGRYQLKA